MNRVFYPILRVFIFALFSAAVRAEPTDKNIVSRTAEIDGVKLHYMTAGHGPTVILLHGFAETSRMWKPIIPLLAEKDLRSCVRRWIDLCLARNGTAQ